MKRKGWRVKLVDPETQEVVAVSPRYKSLDDAEYGACVVATHLAESGVMVETHIYRPNGTLDHAHKPPQLVQNWN